MSATTSPEPDAGDLAEPQVPCIVCRAKISERARLCPTCKSYQRGWKNGLAYFGSTAGFLAILFSALTFILSRINDAYQKWEWHDEVSVVYFEHPGRSGYTNKGDGDLYVVSADIDWDDGNRHITIPLDVTVPKGKFVSFDTITYYDRPAGIDQGDWASEKLVKFLQGMYNESMEDKRPNRCAEFHFFTEPHVAFDRIDRILQSADSRLLSSNAAGHLNVLSLHSGELLKPAPALTELKIAFLLVGPGCQSPEVPVTEATFPRTVGAMGIRGKKPGS